MCCLGKLWVTRSEKVKDARMEVHVLYLQNVPTLLGGCLHGVGFTGYWPEWTGAIQAQPVLLDEFIPGAPVQAELETAAALLRQVQSVFWHPDGEGEVAAHLADENSAANVKSLDFYLAKRWLFSDAQAASPFSKPTAPCPIVERQREVLRGRLVDLLFNTAGITLEYHSDLVGSCCARPGCDSDIRDLHREILIVNKRPGPLHFTSLKLIFERPQMRVPKQSTVGKAPLNVRPGHIVASLCAGRPCGVPGSGRRGGPITGAVVLREEFSNAENG